MNLFEAVRHPSADVARMSAGGSPDDFEAAILEAIAERLPSEATPEK